MKKAKRILALITSLTIVASNISPAFAGKFESEYNDINKDKKYPQIDNRIINTLDNDEIYNLKEGESISDPEQPDVYTYRWSYKRPVTGRSVNIKEMELASQPYVASVGEKASEEEKAKVNYKLKPPILKGYKKPEEDYQASYDFIKDNASEKEAFLHNGTRDINYEPTTNSGIKVKHLFQKLEDRNSYENLDGGADIITKQKNFFGEFPKTGQKLKLDNLFSRNVENPIGYSDREFLDLKEKIKGFEPERNADNLEIIVPEVANAPFVIHYNRKSFQVKINTDGGTYIPDMTLFYGQTIPPVTQIPKKDGAVFDHWEADKDISIKDKSGETTTIKAKTPIDMKKYQDGFRHAMPAEDITFKAIYKENETAEYSVEFWVEKADYDDKKPNLSIKDKYEFVGNRVLTGKTGSVPDIASTSKDGIAFPDLDKARLNKIYKDSTEFDKYFKYNKELTDKQNQDVSNEKVEDDSGESVYKKVSRTIDAAGNTSYKIYFDRQVYTLYFSKLITEDDSENHFWPIITKDGKVYDSKKGNPYSFKARFNQNLQGLWPDPIENVKGYPEDYRSLGWVASTKNKEYSYRDTPPYRLTADDFLDSSDIKDKKKGGYSKTLPLGDAGERPLGEREMCFGIDSSNQSRPFQVQFIMDTYPGFEVEGEHVESLHDFSLQYRKFDTPLGDYGFTPPDIEGFEPKNEKTTIKGTMDVYDWEELNDEDSDRLEEFKTYLKFIGAPREDVKNYKDLYNEKYKIRFLGQFPEKVENDQEEENQEENKEENNQEGNQEDKNKEENNQEKENVQPIEFNDNANLEFEYSRKSYTINFNNDPRKVRDDTSYKDSEKESVPYQHPLRWLDGVYNFDYEKSDEENKEAREKYDQEHIIDNRVPEKPAWVPESWKFLGWSLNPEGTTLVRDGNYTMPARNITLYAKWGCDTKRKVTFDLGLDAGETTKYMIKANDLKSIKYDVGDDVRTSIKENKKYKLPTEDKTSTSGKQVFLVDNGLSIKSPAIPRRPGYDFMGWEHVVYKKDSKGDDTSEVDDSFKQKYHLPRQYTFESEVYSDVYLKAIWAKNNLYDVKIKDHILDDKLNEVRTETNILENQREGTFAFYFARLQGEKLTLVADKELDQAPEDVKNTFTQYRAKLKEKSAIADNRNADASDGVNTYYQNVKVDPATSPNAYNELQFFYKPYRKREYKVNYLLVDNNADLNDTTKYPSVGKADPKLTKPIMDQDDVLNGNRHYDARNFRSIPGFKLVSKPQVQLVFEVNEESNKLLKINGVDVGNDLENAQVNFYYKDIRVIKNNGDKPPKGYHRVSFIAKDHGSFGKDEDGKPIKEVHYDVIDGLYFAKAHVPTNEGKKDKNDADLIADPGYQIGNWSQEGNPTSGLLDPYTVISKDYTFEINFIERKYPEISPIKVFESAKEDDSYINNFMLTKADYDKALEDFIKMPDYESYQILDDDKAIYEKLKEDPLYRDQPSDPEPIKTSIRVKINFKDKSSKEFTIPVLVYKNIYRALDSKSKPNIVNKDDFLKDFVKVTVDPTDKATDKQTKTYYVNKKAQVLIPEKKPTPEDKKYTFEKWSDGKVDYNFNNRFKFQKETEIQAIYKEDKKDVIAYDPKDPITRPEGYVRVSFKADEGLSLGQEKAYYIRKEAKINLGNKAIEKPSVNNDIGYKFDKWDTDDTKVIDNDLVVTAKATKANDVVPKTKDDDSEKPDDYVEVKFVAGENGQLEKDGKKIKEKIYYVNPTKYVKLSPPSPKANTGYKFGNWSMDASQNNNYTKDTTITANFNQIDSVIPKTKDDESEKPSGYVTVNFVIDPATGGKIVEKEITTYYVKPNTEVTIPQPQTKADIGYEFEKWEPDTTTTRKYTDKVTTIKGTFKALPASIPAKDKDEKDKPNGYIRIVFRADKNGWLADEQNNFIDQKVYYVNPKAKIDYVKDLTQGIEKVANPAYTADGGSWKDETGLLSKLFTKDKLYVYHFKEAQNIIAEGNGQPIPDGFVTVSFKADENGKLEGDKKEITYYVNPQAGIKLVEGQAGEKELQIPDTKPDENYKFIKWFEAIDKNTPITGNREYVAIFGKTEVSLSYDLNGGSGTKPETKTVPYGTSLRLATDEGISKKDAKFIGWDIEGKIYKPGAEITLTKDQKAIAKWTDDENIISYNPKEPITRPDGYVRVSFKADKGLSLTEEKAYYVKADKAITLKEIKDGQGFGYPTYKEETGYSFDKWDKDESTEIKTDIELTAKAREVNDVVPKTKDDDSEKPAGFVKVTFVAGANGNLGKETNTFFVNPNKYVKLSPPSTKADTGYVFAGWDKNAKEFNIYDTDTTIKASFNQIDSVIAKTKDDGSEKPAGFVEVNFAIDGEGGKIVDGQAKTYYVKPNTEVTIPQPQTKADIGYEFDKWEPDTTTPSKYTDKVTTIKGSFKALPAYIPAKDKDEKDKPNGYIRIVFRADKNGWLADEQNNFIDQKVYYVNPKAKIDYVKDLTQGIEKVANPAYTADGGSWKDETGLLSKLFTKDKLFVYHFKEAKNVIPDGEGQPIPKGFVKVSFKADENGKLEGDKKEITYYVNPQAGIKLVKGVAGEKELQVPKAVANANYTFTKWVEDLDLENPITGDREYVAKFAKGQVSLSYKIGKDAQGTAPEKVTRAKGTKVRLASDKGISKKDHTFKGWKIGEKIYQAGDEITLKEITTATAQWEKDADVIPYDPENPIAKPQGYVRVSFEADDGLTLTNVKNYYVKKNAGIKIGDKTIVKPTANAKTGYEFETWSPKDQEEIKNDDIVVKAKSNPYKDTIEKIDKNTKKPDGYVEVKFVAGKNGQLEKDGKKIEEKIYYVNPNKYVKLIPPATKGDTGYEFGAWDKLVTGYDIYKEPSTTITANFNEIKAVIPKTDDSEKQEGYVEVNFEIEGDGGKIVDGQVTSYYVDPTREVTINPPATQAGIGYVFEKWNPDTISKAKKYNDNTTVKGNFKKLDNLIPSTNDKGQPNPKPQGYVTVTFKADTNGSLKGETKYYVNPTKEVDLTADANKIEKIANTGYTSDGGSWKDGNTEATLKSTFTKDTEFVYNFKGLADVIPKTRNDDKEKPQGYIEVSFDTTDKGTIENSQETTKVVYVNPEKAVVLEGYAPKVSPKTGYTFANWDTSINKAIQYKDKDKIKATYTDLENISTTKKAGFVKAIFKEGEHGSLEGTSEYWIKPNTEVKIPAPRVKTNIGYSFEKWDKNLKVKLNDDSADYEITAEYKKLDDIIPDDGKTEKPADYITITFQADSNGSLRGITRYFVNPDKEVDLTQKANHIEKIAKVGYTSDEGKWKDGDEEATLNASFSKDKTFIYNFTPYKDIIPAEKIAKKPSGYVKVTFKADENGKLAGDKEEITYYVNPQAGIKLKVLGENEQVADKELAVPDTKPDENYKFIKWFEAIDKNTPITGNREYVAIFGKTEVSLSYDLNGGSGTKPETKTVPYGTSLRLATDEGISKKDAKFIGWSIDGQIYKPGAEITLTKDQKAIAKWTDDENIISYNPKDPITRPSGYVRVTFKADKGLSLTEEKAYYVKADKGISLKEIKDNKVFGYPAYTEETGYSFDKWDKDDSTVINKDIELTAKATKAKDVVPKTKDDDSEKPDGYVKVTFVAGVNGKLGKETNTFFVDPTKYVKLTPPSTKADTGYTFAGWDKNATEFNIYDTDTTITAGFNPIDSVIPKTKDDESEKPSGYVTVNFGALGMSIF